MDKCCFSTISCKLDFCSKCFEVQLKFTNTAYSCGLSMPWCFYQRSHFFWLNFFQYLIIKSFGGVSSDFIPNSSRKKSCDCSVDTELMCRVSCSIWKWSVRSIRTEVHRLFVFLLPQDSTSQRRNTFEYWLSRFLELFHHHVGCVMPFSFRKVIWYSIQLLFASTSKECPVPLREFLPAVCDLFGIWHTMCFWISSSGPINIIEHRNENDSSFTIVRFNVLFLQVFHGFFGGYRMTQVLGKYSTRTQSVADESLPFWVPT